MEIRVLTSDDVVEYRRIRLESLQKNPEAFCSSYAEESVQPDVFFISRIVRSDCCLAVGAFDAGTLVATAGFFREKHPMPYHKGYVVGVYVTGAYRGKGIGKAIMKFLVAAVRKYNHLSRLELQVNSDNEVAKRVYQSCGFITEGPEKDAVRGDNKLYAEYCMVCCLDQ